MSNCRLKHLAVSPPVRGVPPAGAAGSARPPRAVCRDESHGVHALGFVFVGGVLIRRLVSVSKAPKPVTGRFQAFPGSPPHGDGRRERPDRSSRATRPSADRSRFATSDYQGFKRCSPSPRSEGTDRSRRREPRRATRHRPDRKLALPRLLPLAAGRGPAAIGIEGFDLPRSDR